MTTKEAPARMVTPQDVLEFARQQGLKIVDFKFVDLPGTWQHFSATIDELGPETFSDGIGFDGSSIRGFQAIHESDMLLFPDPATAIVDPVCSVPTLSLTCNVVDPLTRQPYSRDPRYIAQKAEAYLRSTGIADTSYWGPEAEFFIFDNVRFEQNQYSGFYAIDSEEGIWNSSQNGGKPNLGHRPRWKEGYFPVAPADRLQDLRSEIVLKLVEAGVPVEVHHHEVATAGQCEIDFRFSTLLGTADNLQIFKYVVRNTAYEYGKAATFMPKPLFGDNGSGMHCHQSLWKGEKPLFAGDGYAGLSEMARFYIGGLLKHAAAIVAFAAPTTNSYKRLVPGFEAPVNLAYSARNRSAAIRIPMFSASPKLKRLEFRPPDPSCNAYLAFSAMLLAGLDGIQNRIDPGDPLEKDIYDLSPEELKDVPTLPGSLDESLAALEADHDFLLKGDVFSPQLIERWISYKREREINPMRMRPHPLEFGLYFDI